MVMIMTTDMSVNGVVNKVIELILVIIMIIIALKNVTKKKTQAVQIVPTELQVVVSLQHLSMVTIIIL